MINEGVLERVFVIQNLYCIKFQYLHPSIWKPCATPATKFLELNRLQSFEPSARKRTWVARRPVKIANLLLNLIFQNPPLRNTEVNFEKLAVSVSVVFYSRKFVLRFCLFCFVWMDTFPKEGSGYPIRDFASRPGTEETFLLSLAGSITKQPQEPWQIWIQTVPEGTRVCALPLVEPQIYCRPSAGIFEPLEGSLSTSHLQIPPP